MADSDRLSLRRHAMVRARQMVDLAPPRLSLALIDAIEGRSGEPEMAFLPALVRPGSIAVDAGANRGLYTRRLARLCPRVIACEPQPRLARRLAAATPDNVLVFPVALSATAGQATLHVPLAGSVAAHTRGSLRTPGGDDYAGVPVLRLRLDDLALDDVGFMKLDVEGHELPALEGAAETLERSRPRLIVECDVASGTHPAKVADHLAPHGYEGWFYLDGRLLPVAEFDVDVHQASRKEIGGSRPTDQATNFLFVPDAEASGVIEGVRSLLSRP